MLNVCIQCLVERSGSLAQIKTGAVKAALQQSVPCDVLVVSSRVALETFNTSTALPEARAWGGPYVLSVHAARLVPFV